MRAQIVLITGYMGIAAVAILVTPYLGTLLLSYLIHPAGIFSSNPWYLPLPMLGLLTILIATGCSGWLPKTLRPLIWTASTIYWLAWLSYLAFGMSSGPGHWTIWIWHVQLLLISVALLVKSVYGASNT